MQNEGTAPLSSALFLTEFGVFSNMAVCVII